jgi:chloramphenicol 3-O-phosphotransferase
MNGVTIITGVSAAGKSTIGQLLADRFDRSVHVKGDVFRRMVVGGRARFDGPLSDEAVNQLRLRYRLSAHVADRYCAAGFTTIVQDVIVGRFLTEYVELVTSRPRRVVVLAPDASVVARREAARPKVAYTRAFTPAAFDAAFRADTPPIGLWLDTSRQTPAETVEEIIARADETVV